MSILVVGGGICGLGAALLLARDGHEVTVLERDPDSAPASAQSAWDTWERKGVAQFRQPHNFMPGLRLLLDRELPEIQPVLANVGASRFDMLNPLPPTFTDRTARSCSSWSADLSWSGVIRAVPPVRVGADFSSCRYA